MSRPCGCLGGNENCSFCYGSGYVSGDYHGGVSRERRDWSAGSVPSGPFQRPLGSMASSYGSTRLSRSDIICDYCKGRFTTANALNTHVEREHVADEHDRSEAARAKPLLRVKGQ